MKARLWMAASAIFLAAAGCSGGQDKNAGASNDASATAGDGAPARRVATPEQFTRAIDCTATLDSVATLFGVIGETKSGAERDRIMQISGRRRALTGQMARQAVAIGTELGMPRAEIGARLRQSRERLRQESSVGDFADFAARMGREADRCVAEMPGRL